MKNLKKLLLVFFFTVAVSLFVFAIFASAEEVKYPVEGGNIYFDPETGTITGADNDLTTLDIPAEINGVSVTAIAKNAFKETATDASSERMHEIVNIPASVDTIGLGAFEGCKHIKEFNVSEDNKNFCDIDGLLCSYDKTTLLCYPNAKELGGTCDYYDIPDGITAIGTYAFTGTKLDVLDLSGITNLSTRAFSGVDIYAIIVSGRLEKWSASSFYSSTNKYLYYKGDYSGWDAALGYKSTKKYYLGYVQADYSVEGGTIYYDLMTNYIVGCDSNMKVVDIPAEINGREVTGIYKWAFEQGYYLESINIPATVKGIDDFAFLGSDNLKSINVDDANPYLCDVDGVLFNSDKTEIIAFPSKYTTGSYTLPKTVERIGNSAFGHVRLDKLDLSNVTKLDEGAFIGVIINELVANANLSEYSLSNEKYYSKSVTDDIDKGWSTDIDNACFTGSTAGAWKELLKAYCNNFVYGYTGGEKPQCEVSSVGLAITVHNLDGVKDFFIGKGIHTTYREVKNNSVMRVTEVRINGADKYTHTVNQPGDYTICVRFNDGSENLILYTTATAYLPKIETNGIAVTVSNIRLKGVRVIRTAPGVWNTPGEVKRAAGCRNFTANTIGNGDSYTVYYPESGTYTLTLEYSNGLVVVEHIELNATEPTLVQDGNCVTIGNLDDLYTIRYAKGEYQTMGEIKRAEGCQVRRSRDIKDGVITVTDLEPGTYTFCVQYNDNSYNYFTVVVE
ncbi:MAG: leucine-rich repeat protein [Clostridia bacterium]|nr:leucine-rich repeat protein [Clostridia bacterium]